MSRTPIAITRDEELEPLLLDGEPVVDAADTIAALLARELSPRHVALFAEPVPDPVRGEIDWFAGGEGAVAPFASLSGEARAAAQAELDRLIGDIRSLAQWLRSAPFETDRKLGESLVLALRIPDPDSIRLRQGQPILIGWGHRRRGQTLAARADRLPVRILPPPPAPVPSRGAGALWGAASLGGLALFTGACLLLINPFDWLGLSQSFCRLPRESLARLQSYRDEEQHQASLRAQLATLVDQAGERRLACMPGVGSADPAPVVAP